MAKSSAAAVAAPAAEPAESKSEAGAAGTPENDRGERIRLGKRYCVWKPGGRPVSGYLLGISGIKISATEVKEVLVVRTDKTTDAYDWDPVKKEAVKRDSTKGEDLAVFLTTGLESLRAYAVDPSGIRHVFIPKGNKLKLAGNKTFWQYISDDPNETVNTLDVSVRKWKRSAHTIVQQVVAKPRDEDSNRAPAGVVDEDVPNEDFDEIPF